MMRHVLHVVTIALFITTGNIRGYSSANTNPDQNITKKEVLLCRKPYDLANLFMVWLKDRKAGEVFLRSLVEYKDAELPPCKYSSLEIHRLHDVVLFRTREDGSRLPISLSVVKEKATGGIFYTFGG